MFTIPSGIRLQLNNFAPHNRAFRPRHQQKGRYQTKTQVDRPWVDYRHVHQEADPLSDPLLLNPVDKDLGEPVQHAITEIVERRETYGLQPEVHAPHFETVNKHMGVFRASFSAWQPAKIRILRIALTPNAKPVRVYLRNYSKE